MTKRLRIIAGPNGSGKTTLFHYLEKRVCLYDFINADELKLELEKHGYVKIPFAVEKDEVLRIVNASTFDSDVKSVFNSSDVSCRGTEIHFRKSAVSSYTVAALADFIRYAYVNRGRSLTVETVFSHASKLDLLKYAQECEYRNYLYFIATSSPDLNVARVQQRAALGGHDVPQTKIRERYQRCLKYCPQALEYVYRAYFWDNSGKVMQLFAELKPDHCLEVDKKHPQWFDDYVRSCFRDQ